MEGCKKAAEVAHWENIFSVDNVNDKVTILENTIHDILDTFAPFRTFIIRKPTGTPWITDDIKAKMNDRDRQKVVFNVTGGKKDLDTYKLLKNEVTSMMRKSHKKVFNDTINSKVKNPRDFYAAINKLQVIADKSTKGNLNFSADKLNSHFISNNNMSIDEQLIDNQIRKLYNRNFPCIHKFSFVAVNERDVIKAVNSIKTLSEGVDNINAFALKLFINRISTVLTHIINTSLEQNIFPVRWKHAVITPIPKIAIPLTPNDFRPISLLTALSKIIERLVNQQIVKYINKHNLLDPYQSAYRENYSTTTALLKITEDILEAIDDSDISLLVLLDFSKAFDTVNHRLLIEKLRIMGFDNNACDWIQSYLTDRYQMVKSGNSKSEWSLLHNGVPQGSILGPLLFTILVSDMRNCIWEGSYHMYADDTQLYFSSDVNKANETIAKANVVLENISQYCVNNVLKLNENKCHWMFIGSKPAIKKLDSMNLNPIVINNTIVKRVKYAKNLGVTFDEVLSWRKHINICISKAMGVFLQFSRYKYFLMGESKKLLCESLVLSKFNYCDAVYINLDTSLQLKIQRIQNLCLRFIFNIKKRERCNYDSLRKKIGWLDMKQRRMLHSLTIMFKILTGRAPEYLRDSVTLVGEMHALNTRRQTNNIWIGKDIRSKIHRNSFIFYTSRLYNEIPEDIRKCKSVPSFKNKLTKFLINNALVPNPPET